MAVVDGDYFYSSYLLEGRNGGIELTLFHSDYWQELISGNLITSLLVCYAPKEFRVLEEYVVPVEIKIPTLQRTVRMDSSHNYNKARRLFREGDIYTAKKNFVHGLRYLLFALQLIKYDRIVDFTEGNKYWKMIMDETSTDLAHYEATLEPIYNELTMQLKSFEPSAELVALNQSEALLVTPLAIRSFGLEVVVRQLGITCRRDRVLPNLIHLSHDLSSPLTVRVAQECSGMVVDEKRDWQVVAMPFSKMFSTTSTAEGPGTEIDWASVRVTELLDGKMVCLYWLEAAQEWRISTKWTTDGSEMLGAVNLTKFADWSKFVSQQTAHFSAIHPNKGRIQILPGDSAKGSVKEAFWNLWNENGWMLPDDKSLCYMFELLTPTEINVVEHKNTDLVLTGCRSLVSQAERDPIPVAKRYGWKSVTMINLAAPVKLVELEAMARKLDPIVQAGFVACDQNWKRLQVRCPSFHALEKLHPMNDPNMNKKLLFDLIRTNEFRGWTKLEKYSHWVDLTLETEQRYQAFCQDVETFYNPIREKWDVKKRGVYAGSIKMLPTLTKSLLFELMDLECIPTLREYLSGLEPQWRIMKMMDQHQAWRQTQLSGAT
eukprot:TRINITY_DN2159_c0_g1_i1.p1 TRINITY_DN2159_c0_g1~~TRINITY_DN2159_c0_g1_i1.p1  ORF type:complete len:660 (-),score=80.47 TRINITY_DN2159_c0_g1_i1:104-1909(-)